MLPLTRWLGHPTISKMMPAVVLPGQARFQPSGGGQSWQHIDGTVTAAVSLAGMHPGFGS
jgi:hypothetical protein